MEDLEAAIKVLLEVFEGNVARKPGSKPFNRAVFDFLAFYAQRENVRTFMTANPARVARRMRNCSNRRTSRLPSSGILQAYPTQCCGWPGGARRLPGTADRSYRFPPPSRGIALHSPDSEDGHAEFASPRCDEGSSRKIPQGPAATKIRADRELCGGSPHPCAIDLISDRRPCGDGSIHRGSHFRPSDGRLDRMDRTRVTTDVVVGLLAYGGVSTLPPDRLGGSANQQAYNDMHIVIQKAQNVSGARITRITMASRKKTS